ncbi:uncharacterized protein PAC_14615 [Phialocephala subalpina]|uniref:Uncharacterized protein n=1 Tax=Phialocephala subalpina TaxID=576137 RepID=A0A1L7XID5_9HELO|nr:uncharacterized protein PAC_14615 [Phialocephala subalpina]
MSARRVLELNDDVGDYEVPARLMNKEDVNEISSILGLSSSALNNYEPLPEPPKYGAGKVNPFASDKRSKFIEPEESQPEPSSITPQARAEYVPTTSRGEKVPRLDLCNVISSLFLSRYKFIPPFLELYHEVGTQPRDIAGEYLYKFPETAYGYTVPKEEVRERAAWAWYRTHLLCQRAAERLQARGPNQQDLGLRAMGSN